MATPAKRVAKGIKLLDTHPDVVPQWRELVLPHLSTLDVSSPFACVLYRVFGGYNTGLDILGLDDDQASYGFESDEEGIPETTEDFRALTAAWVTALTVSSSKETV